MQDLLRTWPIGYAFYIPTLYYLTQIKAIQSRITLLIIGLKSSDQSEGAWLGQKTSNSITDFLSSFHDFVSLLSLVGTETCISFHLGDIY